MRVNEKKFIVRIGLSYYPIFTFTNDRPRNVLKKESF